MSKAEDRLENNRLKYIDYTFKRHGIDPDSKEGQLIYYAYGHGYYQAKKDLKLTWEDIKMIDDCLVATIDPKSPKRSKEEFYQEVLKRFKERKGE